MKKTILFISFCCLFNFLLAQCPFDPTIEGNLILCPNSTETLSTQEYDSYQWYRRAYNDQDTVLLAGETMQTISVNTDDDALFYFSVEATLDGCTERSPEVLLDAWAFLPVVVQSSGDFTVGMNGESVVCIGDTMYFTIMLPYNTNITWYKGGNPIPGETSTVLAVTEAGEYYVSGAPDICPDYNQSLGVILTVETIECITSTIENPFPHGTLAVYPNPASDQVIISSEGQPIQELMIYNSAGQLIHQQQNPGSKILFDTSGFETGLYLVWAKSGNHLLTSRLILVD